MTLHHSPPQPMGGKIWTTPFKVMAVLFGIAVALLVYRFLVGLGPVTGLSDGYPWGLWIAFEVVVGTALATGGYAVAILVYLLNNGKYHPLVRPALLTSALGYTLGAIAVIIDIGRWWNVYALPIKFWEWNLNSVLLEVALCIMLYVFVLWIEAAPFLLQRWERRGDERRARFSRWAIPKLKRAMPWIIALGLLLPTMHQSSMGSLMLLAGTKLHPLWYTPLLPLLFLLSSIAMGYAVVVLEGMTTRTAFGRLRETPVQAGLTKAAMVVMGAFVVIRLGDVLYRGHGAELLGLTAMSALFWTEMALFVVALILLSRRGEHYDRGHLFRAAGFMVLAGALYRFSAFLIAYDPGPGWSYFPAIPELLITVGLTAGEIMAYIYIVKRFPIVGGVKPPGWPKVAVPQSRPAPAHS
ncbi:MAG: NrfD/PsrC family molybdoenzyme membrane anchor subunit [Gemmatimonadota bacterium]